MTEESKVRNVNTEFRDDEWDELELVKRELRFRNYTDVVRACVRRVAEIYRSAASLEQEDDDV